CGVPIAAYHSVWNALMCVSSLINKIPPSIHRMVKLTVIMQNTSIACFVRKTSPSKSLKVHSFTTLHTQQQFSRRILEISCTGDGGRGRLQLLNRISRVVIFV